MQTRPITFPLIAAIAVAVIAISGCATSKPKVPYPAFLQVDEQMDVFMASLPGVRAKQLAGDPTSRRTSNRVDLPDGWSGTSGAVPGRSVEIFVLLGKLTLADIELNTGGYAYLPAGSLGFNIKAPNGARIMYFVNDSDPQSVIQTPIIIDSGLLSWEAADKAGVSTKELRHDPGTGARTWLLRIATGASLPWESSSAVREGYLVVGNQQYAECVNGESIVWQYAPGGYFNRPADAISGGPESLALTDSVWLLRETSKGVTQTFPDCIVQAAPTAFD